MKDRVLYRETSSSNWEAETTEFVTSRRKGVSGSELGRNPTNSWPNGCHL